MGRDRDGDLGVQTREEGAAPVSLPRALPLSLHPVTCTESDQGEEQREPGHGGHGQGVLSSVAPQLTRGSPHSSFPSSYPERGRVHSFK